MRVTIEKPTRKSYAEMPCIHGVDAIDRNVLKDVVAYCEDQYKNGEENRLSWHSIMEAASNILQHDLCPETPVQVLGPFYVAGLVFPKRGDDVTIAKGAIVHSTHPKIPSEGIEQKRRQTVLLHDLKCGFVDTWHGIRVQDVEVLWAGTGGYWKWTSLNNVESITEI